MTLQPLVQTPEATELFSMPDTARKLILGDPGKFEGTAEHTIVAAHNVVGDAMVKISALREDKTRNDVQRHAAAKVIADRTLAALEDARGRIDAEGKRLQREATDTINESFGSDPNRAAIQSEIRGWIREQAKTPKGITKIREAMKANAEVGAILFHSPHFLLGLADSVRDNMMMDAIETHLPKAHAKLEKGMALCDLSNKYPAAITKVRRAFFNGAIAAQAASRVEV
jgi:hypothetical protein